MTAATLKVIGNFLYFIGTLILVPAGLTIVASPSTLMLTGPIILPVIVIGAILGGSGKWLKRKARKLEEGS